VWSTCGQRSKRCAGMLNDYSRVHPSHGPLSAITQPLRWPWQSLRSAISSCSVPSTMSGRLEAWASLTTPLTSCHSGLKVLAGRGWMHQDGTWALVPPKNGRSQPKSAAPSRPHWRSGKRRADFGERPPVKRQKQREAQAALKTYSRTVKRKVPGTGAAAKAEPGGQRITRSMASQEPPRGGLPKS